MANKAQEAALAVRTSPFEYALSLVKDLPDSELVAMTSVDADSEESEQDTGPAVPRFARQPNRAPQD